MDYEAIRSEKVKFLYYGTGEHFIDNETESGSEEDQTNGNAFDPAKNHFIILTGSKTLHPMVISDLLWLVDEVLLFLGVDAQTCTSFIYPNALEETGYNCVFEDWIRITSNISPELLAADTGDISLAEAIAVWILKQLGDAMDAADEIAQDFAANCMEIDRIIAKARETLEQERICFSQQSN